MRFAKLHFDDSCALRGQDQVRERSFESEVPEREFQSGATTSAPTTPRGLVLVSLLCCVFSPPQARKCLGYFRGKLKFSRVTSAWYHFWYTLCGVSISLALRSCHNFATLSSTLSYVLETSIVQGTELILAKEPILACALELERPETRDGHFTFIKLLATVSLSIGQLLVDSGS